MELQVAFVEYAFAHEVLAAFSETTNPAECTKQFVHPYDEVKMSYFLDILGESEGRSSDTVSQGDARRSK